MSSKPHYDRIDEEASLWSARLDGGAMNPQDEAALAAWLRADPEHRRRLDEYRDMNAHVGSHLESHLETAVDAALRARAVRRRIRTATAAVLGAAATLALVFFVTSDRSREISTATAERRTTVLDDGTRVDLNARTSLSIEFRSDERHARLTNGEVLFNVTKDERRPFVVETPAGSIRVTGTRFNVCTLNDDRVAVTVLEGTVRVRPASDQQGEKAVTAGRRAVFDVDASTVNDLPAGSAEDAIAWQTGQVVFDDTALGDAIERFARYHARTIAVDPDVADLRLGGRYSLEDLNGLLESVEAVLPVRVTHGPGTAVQITAAPQSRN